MIPATILSWLRVHTVGFQPIMVLETGIAVELCLFASIRHKLSLQTKSWMVLGVLFLLAIAGLLTFGLVSLGTDGLILMTVLTDLHADWATATTSASTCAIR